MSSTVQTEERERQSGWKETLEKAVPSIVALKLNRPTSFDSESPGHGSATGFVVDAEQGIILTNRHVVGTGPVIAEAIFHNNEEIPLTALYRDPVHDFGFFKYDPAKLQYLQVESIPLRPDKACIGTDIRVVGNDAAEKLAIASGTLARLDRPAPFYGRQKYTDFNTFYFQASSGTTGGSSGSPVLDRDGEAIALNAGGKIGTAAAFYLPLDRVKRAYELVRAGKHVPRGTIRTTFTHQPFNVIKRFGLSDATEERIRKMNPQETGMLSVSTHGEHLQAGDVLISINDTVVTRFVQLEELLDNAVGQTVRVQVERIGTTRVFEMPVEDLHAITPSKYIQIGEAVIHPLSYHRMRESAIHQGLLRPTDPFVSHPGYMLEQAGIVSGCVLTEIDGKKIPNIDFLKEYFARCQDRQRVVLKYINLNGVDPSPKMGVIHVDRRWHPFSTCNRDDTSPWSCETIETTAKDLIRPETPVGTTQVRRGKNRIEKDLSESLVNISFSRPHQIDGNGSRHFRGVGAVVDAEKGLVAVDRNSVTDYLGDLTISVADTLTLPAKVVFVHPIHNFALIQYDPALLGETKIKSCRIATEKAEPGQKAWLVGYRPGQGHVQDFVSRETIVSGVHAVNFPLPNPPTYQEHNMELVMLQDQTQASGGVVTNTDGQVVALWSSFPVQLPGRHGGAGSRGRNAKGELFCGIPMECIMEVVQPLREGKVPEIRDLGVDLEPISLSSGRQLGLPDDLVKALQVHDPDRRVVLSIVRRWGGSPAHPVFENGDLIVEIDGKTVTRHREVEQMAQKEHVDVTYIRNGQEHKTRVETVLLKDDSFVTTDHVIFWQGLILQAPPFCVATQREVSNREGVYAACCSRGSPAARSGPSPTSLILEINDEPVTCLADVKQVLSRIDSSVEYVRVRYKPLEGFERVTTLQLDHDEFWPKCELKMDRTTREWHRASI